ncbi:uncharacterized protein [Antedon mediterranea]|uniref:uncharacterized protein n=1 Tax=Antedon mediterranea TaxID=105859 RepID=UPI003AF5AE75
MYSKLLFVYGIVVILVTSEAIPVNKDELVNRERRGSDGGGGLLREKRMDEVVMAAADNQELNRVKRLDPILFLDQHPKLGPLIEEFMKNQRNNRERRMVDDEMEMAAADNQELNRAKRLHPLLFIDDHPELGPLIEEFMKNQRNNRERRMVDDEMEMAAADNQELNRAKRLHPLLFIDDHPELGPLIEEFMKNQRKNQRSNRERRMVEDPALFKRSIHSMAELERDAKMKRIKKMDLI